MQGYATSAGYPVSSATAPTGTELRLAEREAWIAPPHAELEARRTWSLVRLLFGSALVALAVLGKRCQSKTIC